MEELKEELIKLISEKGPLDERTILVSQELDKLILFFHLLFSKQIKNNV